MVDLGLMEDMTQEDGALVASDDEGRGEAARLQLVLVGAPPHPCVPQVFAVPSTGATVGRTKQSDLCLYDEARGVGRQLISREHARLEVIDRGNGDLQLKVTSHGQRGCLTPGRELKNVGGHGWARPRQRIKFGIFGAHDEHGPIAQFEFEATSARRTCCYLYLYYIYI